MVSIDVRGACVDFPIFDAKTRSLKKAVLGTVGRAGGKIGTDAKVPVVEALRNITLSLRHGDRVGLIGHNGVFDLGVGMDPEISGYENIIIRGLFLGMTRKQMEARTDEIAEFTELGDYLSMPLRTYSTGMRVRLALGVVTSIDPEILLLDEGIGAVDAAFLERARDRLTALVERSGILVFASHSDEFLVQLCTSGLWLDRGEIREHGDLE
ncbi:MAG: ABC transporter ATP-binding protein, partial [Actinomycetota bacterium]|nr:ABC transporter ATP-binding protein [Actinomycetota bacterium]